MDDQQSIESQREENSRKKSNRQHAYKTDKEAYDAILESKRKWKERNKEKVRLKEKERDRIKSYLYKEYKNGNIDIVIPTE